MTPGSDRRVDYSIEGVGAFRIRGDQALRYKAPTLPHSMCGSGARWCARADAIFDVPDMHVLDVEKDRRRAAARAHRRVGSAGGGLSVLWGGRGRPWPSSPAPARCAVLRPSDAAEMAGTDLALSRTGLSDPEFQRNA
jgi:hypothetical protein